MLYIKEAARVVAASERDYRPKRDINQGMLDESPLIKTAEQGSNRVL